VFGCYGSFVKKDEEHARSGAAFLLAQVGGQAAARYAERLAPLGLSPSQSGMLRVIGHSSGISQKALAETLSILPSRLVVLVDELEELGLLRRGDSADDRRVYELSLTEKGRRALEAVGRVARAHEDSFLAPLNGEERQRLSALLARLAQNEGLTPGVHPGFRRLGKRDPETPQPKPRKPRQRQL
jgi:DNA-binding MarR family transcriptional regulator